MAVIGRSLNASATPIGGHSPLRRTHHARFDIIQPTLNHPCSPRRKGLSGNPSGGEFGADVPGRLAEEGGGGGVQALDRSVDADRVLLKKRDQEDARRE